MLNDNGDNGLGHFICPIKSPRAVGGDEKRSLPEEEAKGLV